MNLNGKTIQQSTVVIKVLRFMTPKFSYVVFSIEESNDLSTLRIDELHGSQLVQEQRMWGHHKEKHLLKVAHEDRAGRGKGRGAFRGGHGRGRGKQPINKSIIECFKCYKLGQFQYECYDQEKKVNYVELEEKDELFLMSYLEHHETKRDKVWFLKSACSNHMTWNI